MTGAFVLRVRDDIERLGARGLTWVDYGAAVANELATVISFDGYCCHPVDPGTILFTGSVNRNLGCSGSRGWACQPVTDSSAPGLWTAGGAVNR